MKDYPSFNPDVPKDRDDLLRVVVRERKNDVKNFSNLNQVFISGRSSARIPTVSLDISDADRVGDINIVNDSGTVYLYALVDVSGTAEWRRVALSSF